MRTDIPEKGDRRSFGVNQYVYGVCLDLTDGKGFYEWDEIMEELRNAKQFMFFNSKFNSFVNVIKDQQ